MLSFNPFTQKLDIRGTSPGGGSGDMIGSNNLSEITIPSEARANIGGTQIGSEFFTAISSDSIVFPMVNADNTVSWLSAEDFRSAIGAGTSTLAGSSGGSGAADENLAAVFGANGDLHATDNIFVHNSGGPDYTVLGSTGLAYTDGAGNTITLAFAIGTGNNTITIPFETATLATRGTNTFNGNQTLSGIFNSTRNGANSTGTTRDGVSNLFNGTWNTGGSSTTTKPYFLIEPSSATSTAWGTSGTGLGINAASGFIGNLADFQLNGTSAFCVGYNATTKWYGPYSGSGATLALREESYNGTWSFLRGDFAATTEALQIQPSGGVCLFPNGLSIGRKANSTPDIWLTRNTASVLSLATTIAGSTGIVLEMFERTAPSAPAANGVRIYAEDDGAGKTRLMALFSSGAAQQIAIQP